MQGLGGGEGSMWECTEEVASKLYGVDATIIIFVFVLYCIKWSERRKVGEMDLGE